MALKVKARETLIKIGTYANTYRYVMAPELYSTLNQDKVIREAALRSGVSKGVMHLSPFTFHLSLFTPPVVEITAAGYTATATTHLDAGVTRNVRGTGDCRCWCR